MKKVSFTVPYLKNYIQNHENLTEAYKHRFDDFGFPPGHFYSPIPAIEEIRKDKAKIFENENVRDVDLNLPRQKELLETLRLYYDSIPYTFQETDYDYDLRNDKVDNCKNDDLRYSPKNAWYRYSDVIFLFSILRHFKPQKIIEIGAGHSSAVMLDTNDRFLQSKILFTFIEPYPEERLYKILRESDRQTTTVIKSRAQDVNLNLFETLEGNDILFIDSTHVSKTGSDVNYIFFEIFPVLKPGVLIHLHDIFYPFELPEHWVLERKWFWNETYILRAFLMNNKYYEIVLFNSLLHQKYNEWLKKEMPACLIGTEDTGSIWIRKIR